jgi:hypothetical protein
MRFSAPTHLAGAPSTLMLCYDIQNSATYRACCDRWQSTSRRVAFRPNASAGCAGTLSCAEFKTGVAPGGV